MQGIWGLAHGSINCQPSCFPTVLDELATAGALKPYIFGMCLTPTGGVLDLGEVDAQKFTGALTYLSFQTTGSLSGYYTTTMSQSFAGTTSLQTAAVDVIWDSGTTLIVPDVAWAAAFKKANAGAHNAAALLAGNSATLTAAQLAAWKPLSFMFPAADGGHSLVVTISASQYMIKLGGSKTSPTYQLGVDMQGLGGGAPFILGDVFLQAVYVLYDNDNKRLGVAPVANCVVAPSPTSGPTTAPTQTPTTIPTLPPTTPIPTLLPTPLPTSAPAVIGNSSALEVQLRLSGGFAPSTSSPDGGVAAAALFALRLADAVGKALGLSASATASRIHVLGTVGSDGTFVVVIEAPAAGAIDADAVPAARLSASLTAQSALPSSRLAQQIAALPPPAPGAAAPTVDSTFAPRILAVQVCAADGSVVPLYDVCPPVADPTTAPSTAPSSGSTILIAAVAAGVLVLGAAFAYWYFRVRGVSSSSDASASSRSSGDHIPSVIAAARHGGDGGSSYARMEDAPHSKFEVQAI